MRWPVRISNGTNAGGGGGGGSDKFAPRIIVGNVPNGDPAVAQVAPFEYIPDPGDGSGILQALSTIGFGGGEIYIRPGTYDFSLGSVQGPLAVPSGVHIRGAGVEATVILTAQVGDQGAFLLQHITSLSDMTIQSPSDGDDTGTSDALVSTQGTVNISRVRIIANSGDVAVLNTALLCSNAFFSNNPARAYLEDVYCAVFGGDKSKVLYITQSCEVQARGLICQGGVDGVVVEAFGQGAGGSRFDAIQFKIYDYLDTGVSYEGTGGGLSLYDGTIAPAGSATSPFGVSIDGRGRFTLDDVELTAAQQVDSGAIYVPSTQSEISNIHVDRCTITGWYSGVFFSTLGEGQPVVDSWVRDCLITECVFAGIVFGAFATRCFARNNRIAMAEDNAATAVGIAVVAGDCEIDGNAIQILQPNVASGANCLSAEGGNNRVVNNRIVGICEKGMQIAGADCVVVGNRVQLGGTGNGPSVRLSNDSVRTTFTGNSVDGSDLDVGQYALEANGDLMTIGDNVIRPTAGENAINLIGDNCTVVGNTFPGSAGTGILDSGIGNEIVHNVVA